VIRFELIGILFLSESARSCRHSDEASIHRKRELDSVSDVQISCHEKIP
jgi:hypothetical protein